MISGASTPLPPTSPAAPSRPGGRLPPSSPAAGKLPRPYACCIPLWCGRSAHILHCPAAKRRGEVEVRCPADDSLVEIFSRLPAKPLFRFKCVSKDWCGLIADRLHCRKFPGTLEGFIAREADEGEDYDEDDPGASILSAGRPVPLVDTDFYFLTESPEIKKVVFLDSCNGLVLFEHVQMVPDSYCDNEDSDSDDEDSDGYLEDSKHLDDLGYIVCNPATEEWVSVPRPDYTPVERDDIDIDDEDMDIQDDHTYLIFDPAISQHFQLIHLRFEYIDMILEEVHTFSSLTGAWRQELEGAPSHTVVSEVVCRFDGRLHVGARQPHLPSEDMHMILAVGGEGKPFRTLHWPKKDRGSLLFIGQSQGHLLCLSGCKDEDSQISELSIWVLEDYNAEKWILRDNVTLTQLFKETRGHFSVYGWNVVGIHPERDSIVFFAEHWNHKLISYDMDKKEVHAVCSLYRYHQPIIPYIPYFAQSAPFAKKC